MKKTTFFILCLEGAVLSFNVAATSALVPSIAADFGLSQFIVGRIVWLYMLSYGIAALVYGPLARVFDAKKIELICLFFFSCANLLAGLSQNIYALFVARFLMGFFGASVIPLALILIAQQTEDTQHGKSVGLFFSATFVASLSGLFLSGILPWRLIFIIPAILGFILWLHIYFYLPNFKPERNNFKGNYLTALKNKGLISIFSYIFLVSFIYHGIQQWLGVYFSSRFYLNQFFISMLITLTSLSGIFGEALGGWFSDMIGRIKTLNIGITLMFISAFLLVFKAPIFILALLMIVWGFGWTLNHAGISTLLTDLPKENLFEAASLNSSVRFLSGGIGAGIAGALMQKSFNLGFIILGSGLILLFIFSKNLLILNEARTYGTK